MNENLTFDNEKLIKVEKLGFILTLYILGIFMGALDTGIVSPARTIIQNDLGVSDKTGIWMITIYTLAYASVIPFSGKLADKLGRKYIYLTSVFLFGLGSAICGISYFFSSFPVLLLGRVIQAFGGGGIIPIANAEFGTTFPKEKRGMALGLVGAAFGIANILGSSVGSAILDILGNSNWKWLFFINIPICIFILIFGVFVLPNYKATSVKKIDKLGTLVLVCLILSLLYGLKNIDFFDFINSIQSTSVYPYLIAFICLIPVLIFVEKRAEDPVLNLTYFTNPQILIVFILAIVSGVGMMGMVFVPQFAENSLKITSGSGGYFVAILGVFAGVSSPFSGKLIDKYGPKKILLLGLAITMAASSFLAFVAININNLLTVCIGLVLMGLGVGFTLGPPLNYMMLDNTPSTEANSALSTLSLVRSIGTAISPAIMIGFIAHAGMSVQDKIKPLMPEIDSPKLVQMDELQTMLDQLKKNPKNAEMLKNVTLPDLNTNTNMTVNMNSGSLPVDLQKKLETADVTNITSRSKELAERMFSEKVPPIINKIESGIQTGIDNMEKGLTGIESGEVNLSNGISGLDTAIRKMNAGINGLNTAITNMETALGQQSAALEQLTKMYALIEVSPNNSGNSNIIMPPEINKNIPISNMNMNSSITNTPKYLGNGNSSTGMVKPVTVDGKPGTMPPMNSMDAATLKVKIQDLTIAKNQLSNKIDEAKSQRQQLRNNMNNLISKKEDMVNALSEMKEEKALMVNALNKTKELKEAVPSAFEKSEKDYLNAIDSKKDQLENVFQTTVNTGFKQMYIAVFIINFIAFIILLFYKSPKTNKA